MPSSQDASQRHDPSKPAFTHSDAGTPTKESSLAGIDRVHTSMQNFKLGLVASSQTLQDALQSRSALMASLETDLRPIHPLYRIPPETWTTIFQLVLLANFPEKHSVISPRNTLRVIGNVCHGWRSVIQSLPELWSELSFSDCWHVPSSARNDFPAFLLVKARVFTHVLNLSQHLPLNITLRLSEHLHNDPVIVHTFTSILSQQSHRWAKVDIFDLELLVTEALASSLYSLPIRTFPLFKHFGISSTFRVENYKKWLGDATGILGDCFPIASPNLLSLSLNSVIPDSHPHFIPLTQLKALDISELTPHDSRRFIDQLTSLVDLRLSMRGDDEGRRDRPALLSDPPTLCELPSVEILYVNEWNNTFFSTVTMPKLRWLEIEQLYDDETDFADFITRSKCIITQFTCKCYHSMESYQSQGLQELLRSLPELRTFVLHMKWNSGITELLKSLSEMKGGQMQYCPQLQVLDLGLLSGNANSPLYRQFVDLVESRWKIAKKSGISGLQKVAGVKWYRALDRDLMGTKEGAKHHGAFSPQIMRLERLREEGLEVDTNSPFRPFSFY